MGLGYLKLGQNVSTLSGGEAQRLKLASILIETTGFARSRALYVFDEPTTGLHFSDIAKLIPCLRRLIEAGHSVLIVEHNLDVIATSDWVIGPRARRAVTRAAKWWSAARPKRLRKKVSATPPGLSRPTTRHSKAARAK